MKQFIMVLLMVTMFSFMYSAPAKLKLGTVYPMTILNGNLTTKGFIGLDVFSITDLGQKSLQIKCYSVEDGQVFFQTYFRENEAYQEVMDLKYSFMKHTVAANIFMKYYEDYRTMPDNNMTLLYSRELGLWFGTAGYTYKGEPVIFYNIKLLSSMDSTGILFDTEEFNSFMKIVESYK